MINIQQKIINTLRAWIKEQAGITITYIDTSDDFKIIEFEDVYQITSGDREIINLCKDNLKKLVTNTFGWICIKDGDAFISGYTNIVEVKLSFQLTEEQVNTLIGYCGIVGGSNGNIA